MKGFILLSIAVIVLLAALFSVWPLYSVWQQGQEGRAELSKADYNRQVQVVQAQANLEAQKLNAQSEIIRAQGVAQANNVIKDTITDQYIKYLWVQTLDKGSHDQIIYVPTEVGLPITEAGRATQPVPAPSR